MSDLDARRREALAAVLHEVMCCTDPEPEAVETFKQDADALAPLIAGWLAEAEAAALREAADAIQAVRESGRLPEGVESHPVVGDDWLRDRADRIGGGDE